MPTLHDDYGAYDLNYIIAFEQPLAKTVHSPVFSSLQQRQSILTKEPLLKLHSDESLRR